MTMPDWWYAHGLPFGNNFVDPEMTVGDFWIGAVVMVATISVFIIAVGMLAWPSREAKAIVRFGSIGLLVSPLGPVLMFIACAFLIVAVPLTLVYVIREAWRR
jgi:hypothetical protein